jgi:hypothetical protein
MIIPLYIQIVIEINNETKKNRSKTKTSQSSLRRIPQVSNTFYIKKEKLELLKQQVTRKKIEK